MIRTILVLITQAIFLFGIQVFGGQPPLAFPGAEGFGAHSAGGRGGAVAIVSTLEDYHPGEGPQKAVTRIQGGEILRPAQAAIAAEPLIPGSLRACLGMKGPRTILFAVSGTITLKAPLTIDTPFLTIAGQTAPGDGICLKNFGLCISNTHHIIVRYLRIRPGDQQRLALDAISIGGSHEVIIDHCSTSWGIDETVSVSGEGSNNVTVQWCFITESLHDSYHPKGPHGMGSLLRTNGNISFHHNLYAHHNSRSPRPGTYGPDRPILLDFRNNVIANWGVRAGYSSADPVRMNYVGNYLQPGPSSKNRMCAFKIGGENSVIYANDNLLVDGNRQIVGDWELISNAQKNNRVDTPFPTGPIVTEDPEAAMRAVLQQGGASLPTRDPVDRRIVKEFHKSGGKLINSQVEVGGWPQLKQGHAPTDSDSDGMPDDWEIQCGLKPNDGSDHVADRNGDGHTNLEEYLNSLVHSQMRNKLTH